jgi:hypothetical protein
VNVTGETFSTTTTSGPDGTFRIPVPPGTYSVHAVLGTGRPDSHCPAKTVVVSGPPAAVDVELTCTFFAP